MAFVRGNEVPTIDTALVTIETFAEDGTTVDEELAVDTASKIAVSVQLDTQDAVKLVVKGKLLSQKSAVKTITGNQITLTDNVFNVELVQILQGGTITYDTEDPTKVVKYVPPATDVGQDERGEVFRLCVYTSIYNEAGLIEGYEKTSYPNCKGDPVALNIEDNVFRVNEYTVMSAPNKGQAPYEIEYVDSLPVIT